MNANYPPSRRGQADRGSSTGPRLSYRPAPSDSAPETHAAAKVALTRGDYATAIEEYRKVLESNPEDALAYLQISRTASRHLGDPGGAAAILEEALSREWPQEEAALLCMELVDINWNYYHDAATARALLVQIKENMPGTRHAVNAQKRLHEINEQVALEARR